MKNNTSSVGLDILEYDIEDIQETIGYEFNNIDLLYQAFTRRSFSEEHGGENNEVLEFIGDKALDLAVIKIMMEKFGRYSFYDESFCSDNIGQFNARDPKFFKTDYDEGKFTDIKKDLVEKKSLSKCIEKLCFEHYLIMGKGDYLNNVQYEDSVKEDLFEAIVGAVTLDCDWDVYTITRVVENMIDFDGYFRGLNNCDFVKELEKWANKNGYDKPIYRISEKSVADDYFEYIVIIRVKEEEKFFMRGCGATKDEAIMDSAKELYNYLYRKGFIGNKYREAVGAIDCNRVIAQVNELVQKKLIDEPIYTYTTDYDKDGNPIWTCQIESYCISENGDPVIFTRSTKKEAQKRCALELLLILFNEN